MQHPSVPVDSTHPVYDEYLPGWQRIRDVLAGDAAIKRGGEKYVARLDGQTDDEFAAYVGRGYFYNATARTVSGYVGMIFRRDPVLLMPTGAEQGKVEGGNGNAPGQVASAALRAVVDRFVNDVDLRGTTLDGYAQNVVTEVVSVGRAGTLIDWDGESEERAYVSSYSAESIRNWQQRRIDGRLRLSLVVLEESAPALIEQGDAFVVEEVPQLRVLKLVEGRGTGDEGGDQPRSPERGYVYQVEIWQLLPGGEKKDEKEWTLVRTLTPLRRGKPLSAIPFVFHGPAHSRPDVAKSPIEDIVAANLDHYRLNTDYRHGMHFTALPTAFVTGFDKTAQLRIGSPGYVKLLTAGQPGSLSLGDMDSWEGTPAAGHVPAAYRRSCCREPDPAASRLDQKHQPRTRWHAPAPCWRQQPRQRPLAYRGPRPSQPGAVTAAAGFRVPPLSRTKRWRRLAFSSVREVPDASPCPA